MVVELKVPTWSSDRWGSRGGWGLLVAGVASIALALSGLGAVTWAAAGDQAVEPTGAILAALGAVALLRGMASGWCGGLLGTAGHLWRRAAPARDGQRLVRGAVGDRRASLAAGGIRAHPYHRRMEDLVDGWPVWVVFTVLWVGAFARGTATYWVGRGVRAGGSRSRWARHLDSRVVRRAEGWVQRFGAPAVTLGFLTVGVQTAVNASAGMLRMPQRRFLPAVTVGSALWSLVYTTVGITVVDAWLGGVSWWWAVVAVAVVVAIFVLSGRLEESAKQDDPRDRPDLGEPATGDPTAPA